MTNLRSRPAQNKDGLNSNDFISRMHDDVLVMILSLLPIKDAVVTSCLSARWTFLWRELIQLNFDGSEKFDQMDKDQRVFVSERSKYINQVNNVIRIYNHPIVQKFRIHFDYSCLNRGIINKWLQFAVNKKVEILVLDLKNTDIVRNDGNYNFPLRLSNRAIAPLSKPPSLNDALVELVSLKKLCLNNVNVRKEIIQEFLLNSPHLEMISIHGSGYLIHVHVGGRDLKLKHLEIVDCPFVNSIYLSDFGLESFTYNGPLINLRLTNLSKLKEVDIGQGHLGLTNTVFRQLSSCALSLQALSFNIYHPMESLKLGSIPELPNVKKLRLTIGAWEDDCLLEFASIVNSCPYLESFIIELRWFSPIKRRTKATRVATNHPHQHLKLFQIWGYYGRISDLELAAYVINNTVTLNKIVIDPRCQVTENAKDFLKEEEAARSSAKHQLVSIRPRGVKLVIL